MEAVKRSIFTLAVLQKYLTDESKIYIFITKVPRVVHWIFLHFSKCLFSHPWSISLQTPALKYLSDLENRATELNENFLDQIPL